MTDRRTSAGLLDSSDGGARIRSTFAPIAALLLGTGILLLGNGLLGTFLPLRANIEAFPGPAIGIMGSGYFTGFAAACVLVPFAVRRVGHIRAFAALAALASSAPLLHLMLLSPLPWMVLRLATGFCMAGLYMVIESWLNERATNANRGLVLSVYTVVNLTALTGGQLLLILFDPSTFQLFCLGSVLVSLAALPVALTTAVQPAPIATVRLRVGRLYRISPVGMMGCFAVGLANGPFWTLGSVYAQDVGLDARGIALFMASVIVGGALLQWPLGRLSDLGDRRRVVLVVSVLAGMTGAILVMARTGRLDWLGDVHAVVLAAGFMFGAFALPLYAICVAHTNDFIESEDFTEAASGLLLAYGVGAAIGPMLASALTGRYGSGVIFGFTALIHMLFAMLVAWRMTRRPAAEAPSEFMDTPRTSPAMLTLDPRAEPLEEGPAGPDEDEEAAAMLKQLFAGHTITMTVRGSEVVETNMTTAEDGKSATIVIPFDDLLAGSADVPDEAYAVVKAE